MEKVIAGYGIKVQTDTGHWLWLTETGTTRYRASAMKCDSQADAEITCNMLTKVNPHATFRVEKLTPEAPKNPRNTDTF